MRLILALCLAGISAACVSSAEFDRDRAYAKCDTISDLSSRNRCLADAIQKAERERAEQAERQAKSEADAERRELGREIAGAEQD